MGQVAGADVLHFSSPGGVLTLDATCVGGTANLSGTFKLINNSSGMTINLNGAVIQVLGVPVSSVSADNAAIKAETALIVADTNELQTDWKNGGRLDLLLDRLIVEIDTAIGEPGQGALPVSAKRGAKIDHIYKFLRNKKDQTSTLFQVYNDAGAGVDHKATVSDAAGTTTTEEIVSGP